MRFLEWLKIDVFNLGERDSFRWKIRKNATKATAWRRSKTRRLSIVPARHHAEAFVPFAPATPYAYQRPIIHDAPRFVTDSLERCFASGPVKAPAGGLAFFRDAVIVSKGCILTADGQVIEESLTNTQDLLDLWPLARPSKTSPLTLSIGRRIVMDRHQGAIHVLVKQCYDDNYGHWIIEGLPRAGVFLSLFDAASVTFLIARGKGAMRDVYLSSLQAVGAAAGNIVELDEAPRHFDELAYVLPMTSHQHFQTNPRCIAILEAIAARERDPSGRTTKIYVSRNKFGLRRLLNEDEIIARCERSGFEIVYPERLTFQEQVKAFADAGVIVGNCGASLANIAFAPRGATLFALTSEFMHDAFYWDLASAKGIRYVSLHGKAQGKPTTDDYMDSANLDFVIDPAAFETMLSRALGVPA